MGWLFRMRVRLAVRDGFDLCGAVGEGKPCLIHGSKTNQLSIDRQTFAETRTHAATALSGRFEGRKGMRSPERKRGRSGKWGSVRVERDGCRLIRKERTPI